MKCQMTWNVKWHEMSNDTKCQMTRNVKWHKMSNDTKCQMTQNVKWHRMSNDTKCQMTQNTNTSTRGGSNWHGLGWEPHTKMFPLRVHTGWSIQWEKQAEPLWLQLLPGEWPHCPIFTPTVVFDVIQFIYRCSIDCGRSLDSEMHFWNVNLAFISFQSPGCKRQIHQHENFFMWGVP